MKKMCLTTILWVRFGIILFAGMWGGMVSAQPLDDVTLEYQEQGVVATIRLTGPVQYLRHFPASHGKTLEIYYERVKGATSSEAWVDGEVRRSPPSSLIPSFTVTTRDQQSQPKLVIEFSSEAEYSVATGKDNRSLLLTIIPAKRAIGRVELPLLPTILPATVPTAGQMTPEQESMAEVSSQARVLMVQGRDALAAQNNEGAIDAFNSLLLLPPNEYTQDAQEWVGVARERAGLIDKAKIEYDLYLRLYPEGEGAARVAQRLAGLTGKTGVAVTGIEGAGERKQAARWMTYGGISSHYYYGRSTIDSTYTFNNALTTSTLSLTDQSMLITTLDANERYVSDDYDGRLVFRDVSTSNFLDNQPSRNRINAAYGEIKNRKQDYMVRLGRQSSTGGGVLGRFDGVAASYGNAEGTQYNVTAGALTDYSDYDKPTFVGLGVDRGSYSLYGINQSVEGATDRRAVGAQYRYFEGDKTAFALLDYDAYFQAVNAVQLMGTLGAFGGTMNFMLDSRKSPSLSIRNALIGASTASINALLQTMSASSLRELALARTATSNMGQVGLTVPFNEKWQVGGDVRLSNTSGLEASGTTTLEGIMPATPSRGTEKSISLQVIGSSLYKEGDIWSVSTTFNNGDAVDGNSLYFYNHTLFVSGWTMDTSIQLYNQTDQYGGTTKRTAPTVRGAYQLKEQLFADLEAGAEQNDYSGEQVDTKTTRYFYSAGLRWNF